MNVEEVILSRDILERFGPDIYKTLIKGQIFDEPNEIEIKPLCHGYFSTFWNIPGGLCTYQFFCEWIRGDTRYGKSISKQTQRI